MATKAKLKEVVDEDVVSRQREILDLVSDIDSIANINAITFGKEPRLHTSLLCLDLILGGGLAPGMYTLLGPEQSAKTTAAIHMIAASVDQKVDLRVLWDAEGSTSSSTDYVSNIFETVGVKKASVETVFGIRNDTGWTMPPLVHIKDDYEGAKFFNWLHALQKKLPDKRFANGKWWYVFDNDKDPAKLKEKLARLKYVVDKKMTSENNGIWVEAEDGRLQAIILLDSWPSLTPPSMDEEEGDNSIAVQARFFSKQLPRIKGALRAKRIALVGINQLRINPMARFGNPETEPGGQALQFWSDARLRLFPNALSSAPFNPKPGPNAKENERKFETEPSVTGRGFDVYRYISVKTIKNKLSIPTRTTWMRIWVSDGNSDARGYDPVFDAFYYLYQTGQVSGKKSAMYLQLDGMEPAKKTCSWLEFKTLILGSKEQQKEIFEHIGMKPVNIRKGCISQIRRGRGEEMYVEQIVGASEGNVKSIDQEAADSKSKDNEV